jgi:ketosteroid isomerase-like protein
MEPRAVIERLWERMEARDWAAVGEVVDKDVVVEWPVTAERIEGRENFLAINSEYPEGWSIQVLRIVAEGGEVVSEVEVPHGSLGSFRAVSLYTVRDGRIVRGREYWTSPGQDSPPDWRARYVTRL